MADPVADYIAQFDPSIRKLLLQLRNWIQEEAPEAKESISYGMPAYKLNKPLVYFGAAKLHIGFYPTGEGIKAFQDSFEAAGLKYSKGAVQFPLTRELPEQLIRDIVRHRLQVCQSK
jgi:uncharacterized protein YdhG (YjbR/CyaY superfamily)